MPPNFGGTSLIAPSQRLAPGTPDWDAYLAKYQDDPNRAQLPYKEIPRLNCRWMDVVFCSSIHPKKLYKTWEALGGKRPEPVEWFVFPARVLKVHRAALYTIDPTRDLTAPIAKHEIEILQANTYREQHTLTQVTRNWYRQLLQAGRRGAWFHGVPHVLIRHELSTDGAKLISV